MEDPKVDKYIQGQGEGEVADPAEAKKTDQFIQVLTELMHSPKSRDGVVDTLTASPDPFDCVPVAAMQTNDMAVNLLKQSGVEVGFGTQLSASTFLISDLIHLGYAAAGWEELGEEDVAAIFEDTLQMVVERGLEDVSIDPIQFQLEVEPLLDEDQMAGGKALQQHNGLEDGPSQGAMVDQHTKGKMREADGLKAKESALKAQQAQATAQTVAPQQALKGGQ